MWSQRFQFYFVIKEAAFHSSFYSFLRVNPKRYFVFITLLIMFWKSQGWRSEHCAHFMIINLTWNFSVKNSFKKQSALWNTLTFIQQYFFKSYNIKNSYEGLEYNVIYGKLYTQHFKMWFGTFQGHFCFYTSQFMPVLSIYIIVIIDPFMSCKI